MENNDVKLELNGYSSNYILSRDIEMVAINKHDTKSVSVLKLWQLYVLIVINRTQVKSAGLHIRVDIIEINETLIKL